jgi:enamine deaminase RidA (YjgF/YER057c/UK114 family)
MIEVPSHRDMFVLSGIIGGLPQEESPLWRIPAGIEAQTNAALDLLETRLDEQGFDLRNIFRMGMFIVDITENYGTVNHVYRERFERVLGEQPLPARTAIGAVALPPVGTNPALLEFEAFAADLPCYPPNYSGPAGRMPREV